MKKETKTGIMTAGVGVGGFLGGMAVGYFARPAIAELTVPSWAKDAVKRLTILWKHPNIPNVTWWLNKKFFIMGRWKTTIEAHYIFTIPAGVEEFAPEGHAEVCVKITETGKMGIYMLGGATPEVYLDDVYVGTVTSASPLYISY